jgi:CheY-like chemotaxis protein
MPSLNGIDLCHALREKYPSGVEFVALTAHVLKEERESILQEGFDAILSKPFHEGELLKVLKVVKNTPTRSLTPGSPDLSKLRQMTLNDENLFQSVVAQFLEETCRDITTLNALLSSPDMARLREVVHRLSGRLSQIGITTLGAQFQKLETEIVGGKTFDDLAADVAVSVKRLQELVQQVRVTTMA